MSLAVDLTATQLGILLQQIAKTRDAGVLRKSLAWVEMYRGAPLWKISAELQVSVRSLRRWREELWSRQASAVSLGMSESENHAGGRPSRWDEELDELLEAALSHRPDQLGYASTSWSASLIQAHLRRWAGETFSCAWIRHRLHTLGYTWRRPRYVLRPDPERTRKIAEISRTLSQLGSREVILFEDETDLLLFPPLRSTWAPRGARIPVLLTGWNEKRVVFGALNIHSGHTLFRVRERHQVEDFVSFLRTVRAHYRGWKVSMLLDEHPCHRAAVSRVYARRSGMKFIWLPKRSPELNPLDQLWGKAKSTLSGNRQYEDIDQQAEDFLNWLDSKPRDRILKLAGVGPSFWLKPKKNGHQLLSPA